MGGGEEDGTIEDDLSNDGGDFRGDHLLVTGDGVVVVDGIGEGAAEGVYLLSKC